MTIRASFALVLLSVTVPSTHATFPSTFSTEFFGGNESDVIYRTAFDDSALVFVVRFPIAQYCHFREAHSRCSGEQ